jgi:hypothetical protein
MLTARLEQCQKTATDDELFIGVAGFLRTPPDYARTVVNWRA